jgi:Peptidase U49
MLMNDNVSPKDAVIFLMNGAVPERKDEIASLWARYPADVILMPDAKRVTLNANRDRIAFDAKTMDVFWLIGFAGWKAIECYSPLVVWSAASGQRIADLIKVDPNLDAVERDYKERRGALQAFIETADVESAPWPLDLPRPSANRDALDDPQYKVAFDLTCLAAAFAFLHEFHHVMLDRDNQRHGDLREEEIACDVWAREFMTVKVAKYAQDLGHDYHEVLRKRSMGLALAALILHEITPILDHGGNRCYFSVADRLRAILDNTPLPENDHFWRFAASLLIGIFRQRHTPMSDLFQPCRSGWWVRSAMAEEAVELEDLVAHVFAADPDDERQRRKFRTTFEFFCCVPEGRA